MRICDYCGGRYTPKREDQTLCSEMCEKQSRKRYTPDWYASHEIRECLNCNVEFWVSRNLKKSYCSRRCSKGGNVDPSTGDIIVNFECAYCGKPYTRKSHNQKYCSKECTKAATAEAKQRRNPSKNKKMKAPSGITEVLSLCNMYDITYNKYQQLVTTGKLDEFLTERESEKNGNLST